MTTTKIVEKEKKIRKNLRIKEIINENGSLFYPQIKLFGIWHYFRCRSPRTIWDILLSDGPRRVYINIREAKQFIDEYVDKKLSNKEKIVYHDVNYLTY